MKMRWTSGILGALLIVGLAAHPAAAVVIATHWGQADTPQLAIPATFIDVFLTHENGTRYHCNTGAFGTCDLDIPPGIINSCQAYVEDRNVATFPCKIPVGEKALSQATADSRTRTANGPPVPDDRPSVVIQSGKGGERQVYIQKEKGWIPIKRDIAREIYEVSSHGALTSHFVDIFFPELVQESAGDGGGGGDGGD